MTAERAQAEERLRLLTHRSVRPACFRHQHTCSVYGTDALTNRPLPTHPPPCLSRPDPLAATSTAAFLLPTPAAAADNNDDDGPSTQRRTVTAINVEEVEDHPPPAPHSFGSPFPPAPDAVPLVARQAGVPGQTVLITTHYRTRASLDESAAAGLLRLAQGGEAAAAPASPVPMEMRPRLLPSAASSTQQQEALDALLKPLAAHMLRQERGAGVIAAEEEEGEGEGAEEKAHARLLTEGQAFYKVRSW